MNLIKTLPTPQVRAVCVCVWDGEVMVDEINANGKSPPLISYLTHIFDGVKPLGLIWVNRSRDSSILVNLSSSQ